MKHMLIDDSPSHALHKLGVRNSVKVFRKIGVHDIRVTLMQKFSDFLDRILRTPVRPVVTTGADE